MKLMSKQLGSLQISGDDNTRLQAVTKVQLSALKELTSAIEMFTTSAPQLP